MIPGEERLRTCSIPGTGTRESRTWDDFLDLSAEDQQDGAAAVAAGAAPVDGVGAA